MALPHGSEPHMRNGTWRLFVAGIIALGAGGAGGSAGTWTVMRGTIAEQAVVIAQQIVRIDRASEGLAEQRAIGEVRGAENQRFHEMISKRLDEIGADVKALLAKERSK